MKRINIKDIKERVADELVAKQNLATQEQFHMVIVKKVEDLLDWISTGAEMFVFEQLVDAIKNHAIPMRMEEILEEKEKNKTT